MKFSIAFALVAAAAAQISNEYLPPHSGGTAGLASASYSAAASAPAPEVIYSAPSSSYETYELDAAAPAHSYSDADGYRYKTQRRRVVKTVRRNRRDISLEYLPPVAALSAHAASYSGPAVSYTAPAVSYSAPAETYEVDAAAPSHTFSDADGYRYKTQRRRVVKTVRRNRRDVSSEYLPPVASHSAPTASYSAPAAAYSAPATSYSAPAVSYTAPAVSYSAPAASVETYEVDAAAPAHSFSDAEGYRYKTQRRRVVKTARRNRRDVSSEYLPPLASYSSAAAADETYEVDAAAPAHSFSDADGYRYKTQRRRVVVHRNRF